MNKFQFNFTNRENKNQFYFGKISFLAKLFASLHHTGGVEDYYPKDIFFTDSQFYPCAKLN